MRSIKELLLAIGLVVLSATDVLAQGTISAGHVLGNSSAIERLPTDTAMPDLLDQAFCSARGSILTRGASGWVCLPPGAIGTPLVSGGAGADVGYATRHGNTTDYATVSGATTNGHCVSVDSNGNFVDAGGPCTTGGGGGTVTAGLAGQIAYYPANGTAVAGTSKVTYSDTAPFVVINGNATALPASPNPGSTVLQAGNADGLNTLYVLDGFGNAGAAPTFIGRRAGGTNASKGPTQINTSLLNLNGMGYGTSGYGGNTNAAAIMLQANETWTNTAQGTAIRFVTTPNGSVIPVTGFAFQNGTLFLGSAGAVGGSLMMYGLTSGQVTVQPQAAAGAPSLSWPTASGTLVSNVGSGLALNTTTGQVAPDFATTSNIWAGTGNKILDAAQVVNSQAETSLTDNPGGTVTMNFATGRNFTLTATGSSNTRTIAASNVPGGGSGCLRYLQGGGNNALSLGSMFYFPGGRSAFVSSTGAGAQDLICFTIVVGGVLFASANKAYAN